MHFIRLAAIILGAWLAGSLIVSAVARQDFSAIDELLRDPPKEATDVLAKSGVRSVGALLRHQAAESNRRLSATWELVQIGLGTAILICLFFGPSAKRYTLVVCLLMLGAVCFLHWFITPEIQKLAPGVDFVLDMEQSQPRDRFRSLQTGYATTDTVKLGLGLVLAFGLVKSRRRRRGTVETD